MVDEAPAAHVMRTELTNFYDECWPLQNNKTFVFFFLENHFGLFLHLTKVMQLQGKDLEEKTNERWN